MTRFIVDDQSTMGTAYKPRCVFAGCDDDFRMFSGQTNFVHMHLDDLRQVGTVPQDTLYMAQDGGGAFFIQCGNADGLIGGASDQHPQGALRGEAGLPIASRQGHDRNRIAEMPVYAGERFRADCAIPVIEGNAERVTEADEVVAEFTCLAGVNCSCHPAPLRVRSARRRHRIRRRVCVAGVLLSLVMGGKRR